MVKMLNSNVKKSDLALVNSEHVPIYHQQQVSLPKFKQIPDFYRSRLAACEKKLGKAAAKQMREMDEPIKRKPESAEAGTPTKKAKKRQQADASEEETEELVP